MKLQDRRADVEEITEGEFAGSYLTATGEIIGNVHSEELCQGRPCVMHHPSDHSMREFKTHWRDDRGIMERICPHGIGHPDPDTISFIER